jgi:hypothetical protein
LHVQLDPSNERQTVLGLGFEIQSDSIASGNAGLPAETTSVPHDLVKSERERLADEMIQGFRYCRLAGGLYLRGLSHEGRRLAPRWPEQLEELRSLLERAGVEGVSLEYWSPPPYWKANRKLEGSPRDQPKDPRNKLRCFAPDWPRDPDYHGDTEAFLADFADACVADIETLNSAGIDVSMWGLNNEPQVNQAYSSCRYETDEWALAFERVAKKVHSRYPNITIVADCADHRADYLARLEETNPEATSLVDFIALHTIGFRSDTVVPIVEAVQNKLALERPVVQNEYEYLQGPTSPDRCMNTVHNIMNWFQLAGAPTWFWIHALKPISNAEASGYSLGFWSPEGSAGIEPGYWDYNPYNWHALAGFTHHMPWDSVVLSVSESPMDKDARVLAFRKPDGAMVIVVSNHTTAELDVEIEAGKPDATFRGFRYTPDSAGPSGYGRPVGRRRGNDLRTTLPDRSWEFWVEENDR